MQSLKEILNIGTYDKPNLIEKTVYNIHREEQSLIGYIDLCDAILKAMKVDDLTKENLIIDSNGRIEVFKKFKENPMLTQCKEFVGNKTKFKADDKFSINFTF